MAKRRVRTRPIGHKSMQRLLKEPTLRQQNVRSGNRRQHWSRDTYSVVAGTVTGYAHAMERRFERRHDVKL